MNSTFADANVITRIRGLPPRSTHRDFSDIQSILNPANSSNRSSFDWPSNQLPQGPRTTIRDSHNPQPESSAERALRHCVRGQAKHPQESAYIYQPTLAEALFRVRPHNQRLQSLAVLLLLFSQMQLAVFLNLFITSYQVQTDFDCSVLSHPANIAVIDV